MPSRLCTMIKGVNMRKAACSFAFVFFFMLSFAKAQDTKDVNARSPDPAAMSRMEKKAQKKKVKQKQLEEKAIEIGRKRHEKIQTRDVRKRMKKSKHTASANNTHKREFFLKRWFQPKQRTKKR